MSIEQGFDAPPRRALLATEHTESTEDKAAVSLSVISVLSVAKAVCQSASEPSLSDPCPCCTVRPIATLGATLAKGAGLADR